MITGLLIGLSLAMAAFVTILETAFVRITLLDIAVMQRQGNRQALVIHALIARQDKAMSAFKVGYGFLVLTAAILLTHYMVTFSAPLYVAAYVLVFSLITLFFTIMLPQKYTREQPVDFLFMLARPMWAFYKIFYWPIALLATSRKFIKVIFLTGEYQEFVRRFFEDTTSADKSGQKEYLMQKSLTNYASMPIEEIMIPVKDIKFLDANLPVEELLTEVFDTSASRVLLYQDDKENIVGVLHTQLLMRSFCLVEGDKNATDIQSAISEPWFINDGITVMDQLKNFSERNEQYALIRNKQNVIIGSIALETIFDALSRDLRQQSGA